MLQNKSHEFIDMTTGTNTLSPKSIFSQQEGRLRGQGWRSNVLLTRSSGTSAGGGVKSSNSLQ